MKSKKNRIISFCLVMCMVMLMIPFTYFTSTAAAPTDYTTITAGSSAAVTISTANTSKYFKFVPTVSGTYTFTSSNNSGDPKGELLDASGDTLVSNDDGGTNNNFIFTYDCTAETTYYIKAYMWGSSTGYYTLNVSAAPANNNVVEINENGVHSLFNSGATSSSGYAYSTSGNGLNPDCRSYTNSGYDIYGDSPSNSDLTRGLGLSFYVEKEIIEDPVLTIYAYDIDEEGDQIDDVYLVNDSTGNRVFIGNLQGRDETWSTTSLSISKENFVVGQTYHFEVDICSGGWWTWVRRVSLEANVGEYVPVIDYSFNGSINSNGYVSTTLYLSTNDETTYYLEYTATINNEQKGGTEGQSITSTQSGASLTVGFNLETGSPKGTYVIAVILKDSLGNTKGSYSFSAGYDFSAVNYDSNGGSQNLPTDAATYSSGDTVTVLFNSIPSLYGYTFLGWSTDRNATVPMYTENGTKTFTIGGSDVTLYAVWALDVCEHSWTETSRTNATCTTDGIVNYSCSCGETKTEILIATGHSIETVVETEVTCTSDGLIIDRCTNDGCDYEKRTVIHGSHDYSVSDRKEAACETPGYVEYTCGNCGDKQYEYFDGMHNYVETSRVEAQVGVEGSITYTCTACNDSYTITIPALAPVLKNSAVLLIQDTLPWAENVNTSLLNVLKDRGVVSSYNIINTSALASVDLTQYGVVFIANDQTTGMYERLAANSEKLENYVRAGGNLIYGACDEGWGGCGSLTHTLPGGVTTSNYYSVHNYIVNELHPIVTGVNTDNRSLRDELLKGNYCSHTYFNTATLPEGTDIILRDANGNPTLVEYNIGDGTVIASGLTWEYFYIREHYNMVTNYSKYAFDDLLTYMIYMSNTCEHNYEIAETVAPTCEGNGYTKYVCTLCSHEYMGNVVIATGHTHTETSRTEAGCTVNGEIVYTCACGDVKTEVIAATGHTWELESRTDATCTEYGEIIYGCNNCLATRNELLEPVGHQYEIVNTVEPTCTTDGHIDFACQSAGCDATKQQLLASLGHTYGYDNVCDRCGHTIEIHTHSYTANTVAPTCTAMGYTEYTCSCGHSYKDSYVEPTRHTWDEGVVTVAASCTSDGYITYSCLDCGAEKTVVISAGHSWSEVVTVEKTCTSDGLKTKSCTVCGETETEIIPAGHEWNAGVEIVAATCEGEGSRLSGCLQCGETQTFVIAPLGHNYVDGVCTRCGEEFIDNITASEHPIYGMYFEIDGVVSDYGPSIIDEYGVFLYHNSDAVIEKVAVYLTQDGTMWRRCIAVKGTNIQYAVYVPYLSYGSDIKYTGLNHDWINVFHLSETYNDVWCYSDFVTIGANLEDANGNLLLTLYDIGQAGAETLIFDDLDAMKVWLYDECIHTPSDWIVDSEPTVTEEGRKHKECTKCGEELASCAIAKIPQIIVEAAQAPADSLVTVAVDIANNPGVLGAILKVEYDDALTLVSASAADAWRTLNLTLPGSFAPSCTFVWDGTSEEDLSSGTILILTFRVSADAAAGDVYNVSVSYTPGNIIDADLNPVEIGITNGSVTVVEDFVSGDLSGDGEIGIDDVVLLRRLIAGGYDLSDANMLAADVNKDGKVNVIDVILIRRYIAGGYDVELE